MLEVIVGPMFAGKTSELIRRVERDRYAKKRVSVFKPSLDTRYSATHVHTHNGLSCPAYIVPASRRGVEEIVRKTLEEGYETIGVDEAQFFPLDLVEALDSLATRGVRVIVAGLNLDFRGEPFETVRELLVRADHITYLTAVCTICGGEATRTQRLIDGEPAPYDSPRILVGGKEAYEARCRRHHEVPGRPTS